MGVIGRFVPYSPDQSFLALFVRLLHLLHRQHDRVEEVGDVRGVDNLCSNKQPFAVKMCQQRVRRNYNRDTLIQWPFFEWLYSIFIILKCSFQWKGCIVLHYDL